MLKPRFVFVGPLVGAALCCFQPVGNAQQPAAQAPKPVQPQVWPPPAPTQVPATGQTPPLAQRPAESPIPQNGQIQLSVVVTDRAGNPVAGLSQSDFALLDNNRPTPITAFQAYTADKPPAQPVQVILVIDTANVDFQSVSYSRFGIDQFLRQNQGRLANPVSIFWLTDEGIDAERNPSTDGMALAAQLDATAGKLREMGRAAGTWGAIERFQLSLEMLDRIAQSEAREPGRKLLLWIGPGWPMLNNPNLQMSWKEQQQLFGNIVELSTLLREAHMVLYSVSHGMPDMNTYMYEGYVKGVKKASQAYLPNLDLKVLAVQSGGLALPPNNDLAGQIEQCVRDASAFYTLGFMPPRADGPNEYHELKVRVDKPGLTARTRTGYYNQPPAQ